MSLLCPLRCIVCRVAYVSIKRAIFTGYIITNAETHANTPSRARKHAAALAKLRNIRDISPSRRS